MDQYQVTGMSCAACSARVEKAVGKVAGVTGVSVSLLTNSMGVEGTASPEAIIAAVTEAGYGATLKKGVGVSSGTPAKQTQGEDPAEVLADHETPVLLRRLVASLFFVVLLMYLSMGHMMWGWPLPAFFHENHVAMGIAQMLLAGIVMVINQKFFIHGFRGLVHRAPNMDTLVALGSMTSFVWSVVVLMLMTRAQADGDMAGVEAYMMEFYFESAAMILALITVGKMLEARSKGKTTDALRGLLKLAPKRAFVERDGNITEVDITEVAVGDIFVVRAGESIPVDGMVLEGQGAVDESALTGESIPVDKSAGARVSAATINRSGYLRCQAERVGEDTTLSKIIQMVSDAAATKAPIAKIADRVSGVFVPVVLGISLMTIVIWLICGAQFGFALARGISVLVISCPCALGLATPVAIMVGNGVAARNGILFKTAVSLEQTGRTAIVALDKTGTITKGTPKVTDILSAQGVTEAELVTYAASLEEKSEHPLAQAILEYAREQNAGTGLYETTGFQTLPGHGLQALCHGELLLGGKLDFIAGKVSLPPDIREAGQRLADQGKTPLLFAKGRQLLGLIAVADTLKEDSSEAIEELQNLGLAVVMLTGDNERTAGAIAEKIKVSYVVSDVLPEDKAEVIRRLKEQGSVIMVGDGINDAPALTVADIGMAIGSGTDVAVDAADVVLMNSSIRDVAAAIRLSRATLRNIKENLFWAFIYNLIGIPIAAGALIPLLGWKLTPMFGALAMSLSSFCVVSNALRLNGFRLHRPSPKTKEPKQIDISIIQEYLNANKAKMEERTMTKTLMVNGMMCGHCEARVKKVLEAIDGVESATADHEKNTAVVTLSKEVADEVLVKAVTDADYEVTGIC